VAAPNQLPVWATDGTNNAPPITTQQKSGWGFGVDGVSSYDNWWKENVYEWLRRLTARDVLDQLIPAISNSTTNPEQYGNEVQTDLIYAIAPHAGTAFLRQGSANNKLQISPGILMQLAGGDLFAYRFDGTNEVTIANGDATNPRVDIVQMKITCAVGDANPTVALNVKQGTPAVSPTYPAPDPGYCVVAGVVVGATYAAAAGFKFDDTAGAFAVVHDQRMPLGVRAFRTKPSDFECDPAAYVPAGAGGNRGATVQVSGAGPAAFVPIRTGSYFGRVVGHDIALYDSDIVTTYYVKRELKDNGGGTGVAVSNTILNSGYQNGGSSSTFSVRFASMINIQANHAPTAGPLVLANANGMGPPVWTNGRRAPRPKDAAVPVALDMAGILITANGGVQLGGFNFYIAGGL
jgi:hypothetical protein